MPKFKAPLILEEIEYKNSVQYWRLYEDFYYEIGAEGSGQEILIPKGFVTDFASIPRWLWWIVPPYGKYNKAAVVHDFLYKKQSGYSKIVADAIFYEAMESLGVPYFQRLLMYKAVSYFGKSAYNWEQPTIGGT